MNFERDDSNAPFSPKVDEAKKRKLNLEEKNDFIGPLSNEFINKTYLNSQRPNAFFENFDTAFKNQLELSEKAKSVGMPDLLVGKNLFGNFFFRENFQMIYFFY